MPLYDRFTKGNAPSMAEDALMPRTLQSLASHGDDAALRAGARKGLYRVGLIVAMGIAETAVINRFGFSAFVYPVVGAMILFLILNRFFDF